MKRKLFFTVFFLLLFAANAHVYVNDLVTDYSGFWNSPGYPPMYPSIAYFSFTETQEKWYGEVERGMNGYLHLYSSPLLVVPNNSVIDDDAEDLPNYLLVHVEDNPLDMDNVTRAADILSADIIILVLNHRTWKARLSFWWSHKLPESYLETSSRYFLVVVTPDAGQKLEDWVRMHDDHASLLDSPYLIVGIDDASTAKGSDVVAKVLFYLIICIVICKWLCNSQQESSGDPASRNPSMSQEPIQGVDLALGVIQEGASHECAICLDIMPVGTCVRVLPCRHSFHHDCIVGWFDQRKHTCPLCKFDLQQHLEEQRIAQEDHLSYISQRRWVLFRRRIETNQDGLLNTLDEGDLELTVSSTTNSASGELA
eukprot:CAMPEP_0202490988 /NCGR_PEP_ID=MMETSP1361-20130828/8204_1 /ASSEMBLY_ACC=CAM_ASM_000849 /TAXON_ID=210615 /ORGANISM="Staurosira complex sp., Strain CCMP2646" /LENGTH=368 /DNA_ID=CAMNT_0049120975 /DNA_START=44 /DNA_END=1150 /DNA_ORIENTATION=-